MLPANLTFGVEIECFTPVGQNLEFVKRALQTAGVAVESYVGNMHATTAGWKVVSDGSLRWSGRSLRSGAEVVSPVLHGAAGLDEVRKVAAVLQDIGCAVNVTCGLHVHVGMGGASGKQIANVAKAYLKYSAEMESLLPASRRGTQNYYCKNNRAARFVGQTPEQIDAAFNGVRTVNRVAELMNGSIPRAGYVDTRYYALNLMSYATHGTVEFRQHSGTVNPTKICAWIKLVTGLCATAMSVSDVKVAGAGGFEKLLRKVDPATQEYFRARREAFAGSVQ